MRKTSFGRMQRLVAAPMVAGCEIMHFSDEGDSHRHPRAELAFCVHGVGVVIVGDVEHSVEPGDLVKIPAYTAHHMRPAHGTTMAMFIAYAA